VFLIVINLLNYLLNVDEIVILALGYFLVGGSAISYCLTFIRLYYEIRYGK